MGSPIGAKGTVSLEKEAGTYFGQQRKYWSQEPIQYNGNKVYQRNDLIDPGRVDSQTGLTNKQLMENGLAPYGIYGVRIYGVRVIDFQGNREQARISIWAGQQPE